MITHLISSVRLPPPILSPWLPAGFYSKAAFLASETQWMAMNGQYETLKCFGSSCQSFWTYIWLLPIRKVNVLLHMWWQEILINQNVKIKISFKNIDALWRRREKMNIPNLIYFCCPVSLRWSTYHNLKMASPFQITPKAQGSLKVMNREKEWASDWETSLC